MSKYNWLDTSEKMVDASLMETIDKKKWSDAKKLSMYRYATQAKRVSKNMHDWSKDPAYKEIQKTLVNEANTQLVLSEIVITMTLTIVLFFVFAIASQNYVVNFSVDALFGAVAIVLALRNLRAKYKLIGRYTNKIKYACIDVGAVLICIVLKVVIRNGFDVTLFVLVVAFLITKKLFEKDVHQAFE